MVVCVIVSSPFVTPSRANARKDKSPVTGGGSCQAGRKEYDLPTLPPTHPAECLPVGWNYWVAATPARADAVCSKPSLHVLTHQPAPWAVCPRVRIGRRCVMRFMGLGSDVVVCKMRAESLALMCARAQAFFAAEATLRGQKRNTANDEPLQGAVRDRCVVALGIKSP